MDWKERATATENRLRGLFLRAIEGDAPAYRTLLIALGAHLRAYYRKRMTQWPDDVEDLVQEALLAVHNSRHTYKPEQPFTAWLHTIARSKLVDLLRSRARPEARNDPLDDVLGLIAESAEDAADARRDLDRLLQTIPERYRRALVMTKLEGASVAQASSAIGMSESAVKVGIHRSLKALAAKARNMRGQV
jgi:RNA polymerase sigma-70 factor (ECF subfamily)